MMKLVYEIQFGFLPKLSILYLSDNRLTDQSIVELANVIANHQIAPSAELHLGCRFEVN